MTRLTALLKKSPVAKFWLPALALFQKEVSRFLQYRIQTIVVPTVTVAMYFAVFSLALGSVKGSVQEYAFFLIPGLITMEVIGGSLQSSVTALLVSKFNGCLVDYLITPISPWAFLGGFIAASFLRTLIISSLAFCVGCLFAQSFIMPNFFIFFIALFLTVVIFTGISITMGLMCFSFEPVSLISSIIIQPMVFLSGAFFSYSFLPSVIQPLKYINPIFYIVSLMRYAIGGGAHAEVCLLCALGVTVVFAIISVSFTYYVIARGIGFKS